jgi:hypothetical protein
MTELTICGISRDAKRVLCMIHPHKILSKLRGFRSYWTWISDMSWYDIWHWKRKWKESRGKNYQTALNKTPHTLCPHSWGRVQSELRGGATWPANSGGVEICWKWSRWIPPVLAVVPFRLHLVRVSGVLKSDHHMRAMTTFELRMEHWGSTNCPAAELERCSEVLTLCPGQQNSTIALTDRRGRQGIRFCGRQSKTCEAEEKVRIQTLGSIISHCESVIFRLGSLIG